jgi:hypothetical protein
LSAFNPSMVRLRTLLETPGGLLMNKNWITLTAKRNTCVFTW